MRKEYPLLDVEFLTRKESSAFLRISLAKFDKITDIDCIRYGKSKRFSIQTLRDYAKKNTVAGVIKNIDYMDSENFENFKNNICHALKSLEDLPFLAVVLKKDVIRYCYENNILLECFYLLGMADYLCRDNELPCDREYDDIRKYKLEEPVFPEGVDFLCYLYKNNKPREEFIKKAIPEFLWYNIVENDVRNVAL